jgi:predicted DNA-binding protein
MPAFVKRRPGDRSGTRSVTFRMTQEQFARLETLRKYAWQPISGVLRDIIDDHLRNPSLRK